MRPEAFAREYDLPVEQVRAALAYARAFPDEIEADFAHAEANQLWLQTALAQWRRLSQASPESSAIPT